jgi:integrase
VYSDAEIAGVLAAASALMSALRAATLVGLLVVTRLRIEEAIRLDRTDVDLEEGSIIVRRLSLAIAALIAAASAGKALVDDDCAKKAVAELTRV